MKAAPEAAGIVPAPARIVYGEGSCDLGAGWSVSASGDFGEAAEYLETRLSGFLPAIGNRPVAIRFAVDESIAVGEAYRLDVRPDGIDVRASSRAGAFYGAVSILQMAMSGDGNLPACRIDDAPRFGWRGFMLDTCRNFFSVEFILRMLDLAAFHKLNRFHWHLTEDQAWRLDLEGHPEIAARGSVRLDRRFNVAIAKSGKYSAGDVRRIVAYASSLQIMVIPEIETPGHAVALLASHPELACRRGSGARPPENFEPEDRYGIFEDVLCAGNDATFDLLADVYDEVAGLFPGPLVHCGGDEVPKERWLECPLCRARMENLALVSPDGRHDAESLQGWFMRRVENLLSARGKRMIGWDELLEGGVGKDTIIMSWRGTEGGRAAALAGHEVVMSPNTNSCYLDRKHMDVPEEPGQLGICTVRDSYLFEPVPEDLGPEASARILGGQGNIWAELMYFGRQVEYMAFPRLSALAEVFWSPKDARNFEDFARRLAGPHGRRLDMLGVNRYRGPLF